MVRPAWHTVDDMNTTAPRHFIAAADADRALLDDLFAHARVLEGIVEREGGTDDLHHRVLATLFYEPSTRTRLSFEAAMLRLGGAVISSENAREHSSAAKGETLEDTIRIVSGYADCIVVRHDQEGAAARMAAVSPAPVINGGDGAGEHPTQALLDLYTIEREIGHIDSLRIALVGDLANGRTVHSLCRMLPFYRDLQLYLVAPKTTRMRQDILEFLQAHDVHYEETEDLKGVVGEVDVLYQTRVQKERFADLAAYVEASGRYTIDRDLMLRLPARSVVLHPLPRVGEIDPAVDSDLRAAYFRQARNGLFVRMALLSLLLGSPT